MSSSDTHHNIPSPVPVSGLQKGCAVSLGIFTSLLVGFQAAYAVWSLLLLMELTQVEPRFYVALFCIVDLSGVIVWSIFHRYYMRKFRPEKKSHASSVDLSRASSMQIIMFVTVFWLTSASLVFNSRWPGAIAPGDGHIVQNGMDTKSGIYTIWLMILFNIFLSCAYVVSNMVYLFDLYFGVFQLKTKKNIQ